MRASQSWQRLVISQLELEELQRLHEHWNSVHAKHPAMGNRAHPARQFPATRIDPLPKLIQREIRVKDAERFLEGRGL